MTPLIITIKENLQLKNAPPEIIAALIEKLEFVKSIFNFMVLMCNLMYIMNTHLIDYT